MKKNIAGELAPGIVRSISKPLSAMLAIAICAGLSACAGTGPGAHSQAARPTATAGAAGGAELYRGKYSFVRIEAVEAGAAANQPHAIDAAELAAALALLKVNDAQPVFLPDELNEIVPHLARALARATASEDVVFAVTGRHKLLGLLAPNSVTTGRLFVADGKLNLILGLVQSAFDIERPGNQPTRVFSPGSRLRAMAQAGKVTGGAGFSSLPGRSDWLTLPLDRLAAPSAMPASRQAASPPSTAAGALATGQVISDVERRLAINARLRQQGLVSEEEYQEKRRAILKDY